MKKIIVFLSASILAVTLAGCSNADVGTVSGVAVGGALGSLVGAGTGQTAAIIGGAAVGGLVGRKIGESTEYDY